MTELNANTLSQLPPNVGAPPYDRSRLKRGIAHFGVGNFHRAHQAFYIDRCLALPGQEDWGIVGIGLGGGERGRQKAAEYCAQDYLNLTVVNPLVDAGDRARRASPKLPARATVPSAPPTKIAASSRRS
jgi:sorbose reductase